MFFFLPDVQNHRDDCGLHRTGRERRAGRKENIMTKRNDKRTGESTVTLSMQIPEALDAKIREVAEKEGRTKSAIIREALALWLAKKK